MFPEIIKIGSYSIHSYGVMITLGILAGIAVVLRLCRPASPRGEREGIEPQTALDGILLVIILAFIGARVFYVIEFWRDFSSPGEAFMIWRGGLVFYGGLIFAILGLVVFSLARRLSILKVLDLAAPATAIGYALGRIGCFLNGCCYGAVLNQEGLRHPTQLYSSAAGLMIFFILIRTYNQKRFSGQIFCSGVILYSVYRFLNEFFRINPRYLFGLSAAQLISIGLFIAGIIGYGILYFRERQNPKD